VDIFAVALTHIRVTFDPAKNDRNIAERELPFERMADLEWENAVSTEDTRKDYGETRLRVLALPWASIARRCDHTARRCGACHQLAQSEPQRSKVA
jgi:uncharacterized DUF497 family protein